MRLTYPRFEGISRCFVTVQEIRTPFQQAIRRLVPCCPSPRYESNPLYHDTLKTYKIWPGAQEPIYSTSSAGSWKLSLPPKNHVLSPMQMTAPRIGPAQFMLAGVAGMTVGRHRERTQYQPHANAKMLTPNPTQAGPPIFQGP